MLIPHIQFALVSTIILAAIGLIALGIALFLHYKAKRAYDKAMAEHTVKKEAYWAQRKAAEKRADEDGRTVYAWVEYLPEGETALASPYEPSKRDVDTAGEGWYNTSLAFGFAFAIFGLALIATLIPFDAKYHWLTEKSGTIESVKAVVESEGKYVTETFAVRFEGYENVYLTDDMRITQYDEGDTIDFVQSVEWVQRGDDKLNFTLGTL
jgi:hypothetical protein